MINKLKEYVKKNATILFKTDEKNNLEAIFDEKGFWFHPITQTIYDRIKNMPHLYVAFSKEGFIYIGISNQQGGRWKRQHAYHLGTLAYHLLGTIRNDDQNHLHWIDAWMDTTSLKINNKLNTIALKETIYISFIPFEMYARFNNIHPVSELHTKKTIKNINKAVESALIQSYHVDGHKLLNIHGTTNGKKIKTKSGINRNPPPKNPLVEIGSQFAGKNNNCVEFKVLVTQSVHTQIRLIPLKTKPLYNINVFESGNKNNVIYSGQTSAPYQYFGRVGQGGVARWRIIQQDMITNGIKEVTVLVC